MLEAVQTRRFIEGQAVLTVSCPQCSQKLNAPDEVRGKLVKCASCGHHFAVEKPARGQGAVNSTRAAPSPVAVAPSPRRPTKSAYLVVGLASAAAVFMLVLVVVAVLFASSSVGRTTPVAKAANVQPDQATDELQAENQRLKAQLAQLEASARQADELQAENARLKSQVAALKTAVQKAQTERATAPTPVVDTTETSPPSSNPIVQQWHLENAVVEVQVLKVVPASIGAKISIHVTNRSKAFITYWQVGASVYDRAGKFLGNGTKVGSNLRPNNSVDEEMLLIDIDASAISRWVLNLKGLTLESESGENLFDADKYFTLKELKDP